MVVVGFDQCGLVLLFVFVGEFVVFDVVEVVVDFGGIVQVVEGMGQVVCFDLFYDLFVWSMDILFVVNFQFVWFVVGDQYVFVLGEYLDYLVKMVVYGDQIVVVVELVVYQLVEFWVLWIDVVWRWFVVVGQDYVEQMQVVVVFVWFVGLLVDQCIVVFGVVVYVGEQVMFVLVEFGVVVGVVEVGLQVLDIVGVMLEMQVVVVGQYQYGVFLCLQFGWYCCLVFVLGLCFVVV